MVLKRYKRTGMMLTMWVYLETWIVQDGAPELAQGTHLRGVSLRADCLGVGPARTAVDGIAELVDPGGEQGSGVSGVHVNAHIGKLGLAAVRVAAISDGAVITGRLDVIRIP
jgi:hypothetical protein